MATPEAIARQQRQMIEEFKQFLSETFGAAGIEETLKKILENQTLIMAALEIDPEAAAKAKAQAEAKAAEAEAKAAAKAAKAAEKDGK